MWRRAPLPTSLQDSVEQVPNQKRFARVRTIQVSETESKKIPDSICDVSTSLSWHSSSNSNAILIHASNVDLFYAWPPPSRINRALALCTAFILLGFYVVRATLLGLALCICVGMTLQLVWQLFDTLFV